VVCSHILGATEDIHFVADAMQHRCAVLTEPCGPITVASARKGAKVEFLVKIQVSLPHHMDPADEAGPPEHEYRHGTELNAAGTIQRAWRIPGRVANAGIWFADDASQRDTAPRSLPLCPWVDALVAPPAAHPLETKINSQPEHSGAMLDRRGG
jgi:muconolactone D-isomerase